MFKKHQVVVAIILLAFTSSPLQALTFFTSEAAFNAAVPNRILLENFSTATPADTALPSLTQPSGTYTGFAGSPFPNVFVTSPGYNNYGALVGTTTQFILAANGDENIVASFSVPHFAVGFDAFFNGLGPGSLTVFGIGNSVLGSLPFSGSPANKGYLGFVSDLPIFGFQWVTTRGGELNTGFTNISVDLQTPVPAALPLFATGLGTLGFLAYRRKRDKAA